MLVRGAAVKHTLSFSVVFILLFFVIFVTIVVHNFWTIDFDGHALLVIFFTTIICCCSILDKLSNILLLLILTNDNRFTANEFATLLSHDFLNDLKGLSEFLDSLSTMKSSDFNSILG